MFSDFLQPFRQITQRASPWPVDLLIFVFVFFVSVESRSWSPRARLRVLRPRVVAGRGVESSPVEFCDNDVDDVLVYGTTMGTSFSVLHRIFVPFKNEIWFSITGPLIGISVVFAKFSKR